MKSNLTDLQEKQKCYHCGLTCESSHFTMDEKLFCCIGCQTVFEILSQNGLCDYYSFNEISGVTLSKNTGSKRFGYLELPEIKTKLLDFTDGKVSKVSLYLPTIHCSSCVWLLENLYKLDAGVLHSKVDFLKRTIHLTFLEQDTSLQNIVVLLSNIGYEPYITLNDTTQTDKSQKSKAESNNLLIKIAVAGFCFGNVMLISFPEYFGFDSFSEGSFRYVFNFLNIALSLPALLYSGLGYTISAYKSLKKRIIHIDFPLALGMWVLWLRSLVEIFTQTGSGYMDTLTGLVFFLLIGKWFQQRTYQNLEYDRDFKSYFPVAVTLLSGKEEKPIPIKDIKVGDRILVRNQELIPADAILWQGNASIDYSFVSGEAVPVAKGVGELVYAGGRQMGDMIELEITKTVSQSYLTELWNHPSFHKQKESSLSFQNIISRYFTIALLVVAFTSAGFWIWSENDFSKASNAFTAVLIIACPCALALSSPFALGTAMRILANHQFFVKNTQTVEELTKIEHIIFDKTGTITQNNQSEISFHSAYSILSENEKSWIKSLAKNSVHPLSVGIYQHLIDSATEDLKIKDLKEVPGMGLMATIDGHWVKMGSDSFVSLVPERADNQTRVYVSIDSVFKGYFSFQNTYRAGIVELLHELDDQNYDLHLLSGDNEGERQHLSTIFPEESDLHFRQSPKDKLHFVENLQKTSAHTLMLGDGLNDAGALQQSNVGIAISEDTAYFTPASDVIMDADTLANLPKILRFCIQTLYVIKISFAISLVYNIVGLAFAVQGTLSPIIAAILMPLSSITVILFTTLSVSIFNTLTLEK